MKIVTVHKRGLVFVTSCRKKSKGLVPSSVPTSNCLSLKNDLIAAFNKENSAWAVFYFILANESKVKLEMRKLQATCKNRFFD